MCEENSIEFIGFQYLAEVFNQDKEINPEIAKIQIKILDEKQIWLQDNELANYLKNNNYQQNLRLLIAVVNQFIVLF